MHLNPNCSLGLMVCCPSKHLVKFVRYNISYNLFSHTIFSRIFLEMSNKVAKPQLLLKFSSLSLNPHNYQTIWIIFATELRLDCYFGIGAQCANVIESEPNFCRVPAGFRKKNSRIFQVSR